MQDSLSKGWPSASLRKSVDVAVNSIYLSLIYDIGE